MTRLAALVPVAIAVLGLACSNDPPTRETPAPASSPTYLPRTSPENVLENLAIAYEAKDIAGLAAQLHDPLFTYAPPPGDPAVFEALDIHRGLAATALMFEQVDTIELTLSHAGSVPSDLAAFPPSAGYRMIPTGVYLRIVRREIVGDDPLIHLVVNDPATFVFAPDSSGTPVTWTIILQRDDG